MIKRNRVKVYFQAIEFMKTQLYEKPCVKQIAEHCGVSISGLEKDFQKFADCGIMAFYMQMKLGEGKKLLGQGFSVGEIATRLQFSSTAHFSAAFKKQYGVSPMKYKSSYRKQ